MLKKSGFSVFLVSCGLIFVVSAITVMFSIGSMAKFGLERALGVDNCYYASVGTIPLKEFAKDDFAASQEAICRADQKNNEKRQIADSVAILLVALPMSVFFYRKMRK